MENLLNENLNDTQRRFQVSYTKNAYACNGTALESKSIDWLLSHSFELNPNTEKGKDGAIFAYDSDVAGVDNSRGSGGLLFIDIDNLTKQEATTIFEGFQLIADYLPSLYAVQYSSSHFLNTSKSVSPRLLRKHIPSTSYQISPETIRTFI